MTKTIFGLLVSGLLSTALVAAPYAALAQDAPKSLAAAKTDGADDSQGRGETAAHGAAAQAEGLRRKMAGREEDQGRERPRRLEQVSRRLPEELTRASHSARATSLCPQTTSSATAEGCNQDDDCGCCSSWSATAARAHQHSRASANTSGSRSHAAGRSVVKSRKSFRKRKDRFSCRVGSRRVNSSIVTNRPPDLMSRRHPLSST